MALKSLTLNITSNKSFLDTITITTNFGSEVFEFVNVTTGDKFVEIGDTVEETRANLAGSIIKALSIDYSFKTRSVFVQNDGDITIYCLDPSVTSLDASGVYDTKTLGEFDEGLQLDQPILTRSPKFVNIGDESSSLGDITGATADVYIYKGEQVLDRPTTPTYSFKSISNVSGESLSYNLAEISKDFIETSISEDGVINEDSNYYLDIFPVVYYDGVAFYENPHYFRAFMGYNYFEEGIDTSFKKASLHSSNTIINNSGYSLEIPVDGSKTSKVFVYNGVDVILEEDYTYSGLSSEQIKYPKLDSFEDRVSGDSGTYESGSCVDFKIQSEASISADKVQVFTKNDDGIDVLDTEIRVINQCEGKYEPIKLTFVNKFGAYERLWFFKKSELSDSFEKEEYKANLWNKGTFSTTSHQSRVLTKNSVRSLKINTGYYPESLNESINQLLLSEQVWAEYEGLVLPVNIKDSSKLWKTSLNDKLINYTLELEFAFDHINNIS